MARIFIGPMSKNVVDAALGLEKGLRDKITFIPSRRQIEFDGGYVNNWTTGEFVAYVNGRIPIQRDHGGPGQGLNSDNGLESFSYDAKALDLIHIDPWKDFPLLQQGIDKTVELIKYCHTINPSVRFEIGTEQAIREYSPEELDFIISEVKKSLGKVFDNIEFAVVQGGTRILGTKNVGTFDPERCKNMIQVCQKHGLKSKEHNGDYLMNHEIEKRFDMGLSGLNIAPEFGVLETSCILEEVMNNFDFDSYQTLYKVCLESNKWVKWLPKDILTFPESIRKFSIIRCSGHYVFTHTQIETIKEKYADIDHKIQQKIQSRLKEIVCIP